MRTILFCFVMTCSTLLLAQSRNAGLSATVQQSQFGLMFPIWLGERFVLAPSVTYSTAETAGSEFGLGLAPRYYLKTGKLATYVGIRGGFIIYTPSSEDQTGQEAKTDLLWGFTFGGEYFLDEHFSFGVEGQGNFTKSDEDSHRYGNPGGLNFNLATMILATYYF